MRHLIHSPLLFRHALAIRKLGPIFGLFFLVAWKRTPHQPRLKRHDRSFEVSRSALQASMLTQHSFTLLAIPNVSRAKTPVSRATNWARGVRPDSRHVTGTRRAKEPEKSAQ